MSTETSILESPSTSDTRLRELVLHLSERSEGDATFTERKLSLLLFLCDFHAWRQLARSITGQEYVRTAMGPTPSGFPSMLEGMATGGALAFRSVQRLERRRRRPVALREPDLDVFTAREIQLADRVARRFRGAALSAVRAASLRVAPWDVAAEGEPIPYEVALVARRKPDAVDREWSQSLGELSQQCRSRDA